MLKITRINVVYHIKSVVWYGLKAMYKLCLPAVIEEDGLLFFLLENWIIGGLK